MNYTCARGSECETNRDSGQQERKSGKATECDVKVKIVFECVYLSKRGKEEKLESNMKRTVFTTDLHLKISFKRTDKEPFPNVCGRKRKKARRAKRGGTNVSVLNFSASA